MPSIIATIKIKADKIDEAKKVLAEMCRNVLDSEPGTLAYVAHQQADAPDTIVFYEKYKDAEAVAEHRKNLPKNSAAFGPLVAGRPEIVALEEI